MEIPPPTVSVTVLPSSSSTSSSEPLRLHIGGEQVKEGWKIVNVQQMERACKVDFFGNANDLSAFADGSVDEIYGSHIYEHLDYNIELSKALTEAFRVLKPGGVFMAGVPDLETLAWLLLSPHLDTAKKFHVMRMIFGGHIDKHDYHYVGLTADIFGSILHTAGFREIRRVQSFGLFSDTTELRFEGIPISLNMVAVKPLA